MLQSPPGRPKPAPRKRPERRASVRFAPPQAIVCQCRLGDRYLSGRVCDVSAGGVCLVLSGPRLAVGDELTIELINGPHTFLCARTLRVLRVFRAADNQSIVGGEFDRKLTYDDLLPFIL